MGFALGIAQGLFRSVFGAHIVLGTKLSPPAYTAGIPVLSAICSSQHVSFNLSQQCKIRNKKFGNEGTKLRFTDVIKLEEAKNIFFSRRKMFLIFV